ncbi:DUF2690 domain-containing protein [Arthrobacter woluwensis]|uniref:DUF2690 domain-containing protein n=1 Tax=Arthrobacter woluwensis TaxID=156980 RepID=UPI0015E7D932|nr:DUF2690 domain-containing protein [Arthrobacter woluwensis]
MKNLARATIAGIVAICSLWFFAAPANAAESHHGQDPQASGCAASASTIYSQALTGGGRLEVRYSPVCETNWVRVTGQGAYYIIGSIRSLHGALPGEGVVGYHGYSGQSYWSPMVYAPGSTCVFIEGDIYLRSLGNSVPVGDRKIC